MKGYGVRSRSRMSTTSARHGREGRCIAHRQGLAAEAAGPQGRFSGVEEGHKRRLTVTVANPALRVTSPRTAQVNRQRRSRLKAELRTYGGRGTKTQPTKVPIAGPGEQPDGDGGITLTRPKAAIPAGWWHSLSRLCRHRLESLCHPNRDGRKELTSRSCRNAVLRRRLPQKGPEVRTSGRTHSV